jgi:hypothetical protein
VTAAIRRRVILACALAGIMVAAAAAEAVARHAIDSRITVAASRTLRLPVTDAGNAA